MLYSSVYCIKVEYRFVLSQRDHFKETYCSLLGKAERKRVIITMFDNVRKIETPYVDNLLSPLFRTVYTSFDPPFQSVLTSENDHDVASEDILNSPDYVEICDAVL